MLSLLRNRNYFWLWAGQIISLVGDEIRDWTMIYWIFNVSGESPVVQSLSFIAVTAPKLVLGPFAGVLVDRWDRRKTMIGSDLVRGVLMLAMLGAVAANQYWYALAMVFLGSCVAQFFDPARGALIPLVVGPENLVQANSLGQSTTSLIRLTGPAIGTLTYQYLGPSSAFTLDAFSFALSALCIVMVAVPAAGAASRNREPFFVQFRQGVQFIRESRPIMTLLIAFTVLFMGGGASNSLGIFIVRNSLGLPETALAYSSTASPVITLIASVVIGAVAGRLTRAPLLVPIGMAVGGLGIGLISGAPTLLWVIVGSGLVGLCNSVMNIGVAALVQSLVPNQMLGRVSSALSTLPMGMMLASAGLAGYLATRVNPRLVLGGSAVLLGAAALVAFVGLKDVVLPGKGSSTKAAAAAE